MQGQIALMIIQGLHYLRPGVLQVIPPADTQGAVDLAISSDLLDIARQIIAVVETVAYFVAIEQTAETVVDDHLRSQRRKLVDKQVTF